MFTLELFSQRVYLLKLLRDQVLQQRLQPNTVFEPSGAKVVHLRRQ